MKAFLVPAAMLSVLTASAAFAATAPAAMGDPAVPADEGAGGGRGVRVASAVASPLLFVPDAAQSPLVTVGEGGEGGKGRRWRGYRGRHVVYYRPVRHYRYGHYRRHYGGYRHRYRVRHYRAYYPRRYYHRASYRFYPRRRCRCY